MQIPVECCFAVGGSAQPVRFKLNGADHFVEEILDQWPGADCSFLKLRADDGNLYILRHEPMRPSENWALTSFRKETGRRY